VIYDQYAEEYRRYKMWYQGQSGEGMVGYAWSEDGISWEKHGPPVLSEPLCHFAGTPSVIQRRDQDASWYEMWFTAGSPQDACQVAVIARAESTDGISWSPPQVVLRPDCSWEGQGGQGVGFPAVVYDPELRPRYWMWYQGMKAGAIGLATSEDGIVWQKHPENPVLRPGGWEQTTINPAVIYREKVFEMWYSALTGTGFYLGYATSLDGAHWTKFPRNPVLSPEAGWERRGVFNPTVLVHPEAAILEDEPGVYKMWYTGGFTGDSWPQPWQIGYAEAPVKDFRRGDCNGDEVVDISDAVCTLNWLFLGAAKPPCLAATNTNGDDDADVSDAVFLLAHLFSGGPAPVPPFPDCGPWPLPADHEMGCETTCE
jgi:predicted GH43/DUF377 family glycosyl hydrolase